jgi:hypothetical protein
MNRKTRVAPASAGAETFDVRAANDERADKLRRNGLRRKARANGLELRHSDYGYSLVSPDGKRLDGRNNLTLREVEVRLNAGA